MLVKGRTAIDGWSGSSNGSRASALVVGFARTECEVVESGTGTSTSGFSRATYALTGLSKPFNVCSPRLSKSNGRRVGTVSDTVPCATTPPAIANCSKRCANTTPAPVRVPSAITISPMLMPTLRFGRTSSLKVSLCASLSAWKARAALTASDARANSARRASPLISWAIPSYRLIVEEKRWKAF